MEILTVNESTLQCLQTFASVEEMNVAVRGYKSEYALSKTEVAILDAITRYACKYTGVCYLKKQKIAEESGFTSRRTAIRACHKLEASGIIKQYETRRISGDKRQSVNIIVIQRPSVAAGISEEVETKEGAGSGASLSSESHGKVTGASHPKEAFQQTSLQTNTYKETVADTLINMEYIAKRGLKCAIPEAIYDAFSPFFDATTLYEMYGVLLRAKAKVNAPFMIEDYADRYIDHFYNVIRLYKKGKVKNLAGYLYVTWERLTSELCRQWVGEGEEFFCSYKNVVR